MSIEFATDVLDKEIAAIEAVKSNLGDTFLEAIELLSSCRGRVILCGMGKAGLIARKISATMASTGTQSFFMHPAEGLHGDLGMVSAQDVCVILSNSGESSEIRRILPNIRQIGAAVIAVTSNVRSTLAVQADLVLYLGEFEEACPLRLAPSSSTTAMLALGDALALVLMRRKNFTVDEYGLFHPGGALGMRASSIRDFMRPREKCAVAAPDENIGDVILKITSAHCGSAVVLDKNQSILGIFCDGDLRRGIKIAPDILSRPVKEFMTAHCFTLPEDTKIDKVVHFMFEKRIGEIPIEDKDGCFVGLAELKSFSFMNTG